MMYKMDFYKPDPLSVGTKGLVFIGDKILVYRRDAKTPKYPLHLDVPGGAAEPAETPFATFKREVKEEFGLHISKDDIVYAKRYESMLKKGEFAWYAVAKLPATSRTNIALGQEGIEFMLMPLDEFLRRDDVWPAYQKRAADYAADH